MLVTALLTSLGTAAAWEVVLVLQRRSAAVKGNTVSITAYNASLPILEVLWRRWWSGVPRITRLNDVRCTKSRLWIDVMAVSLCLPTGTLSVPIKISARCLILAFDEIGTCDYYLWCYFLRSLVTSFTSQPPCLSLQPSFRCIATNCLDSSCTLLEALEQAFASLRRKNEDCSPNAWGGGGGSVPS
jgi:hypothetical protein